MTRLAWSLGLFWGSLLLGYWLRRTGRVDHTFARCGIERIIGWLMPVVALFALWNVVMQFRHRALFSLPLIGVMVSVASMLFAWLVARSWRLSAAQQGSWLLTACFSNVGFLGALIAFAVWGESAYGLCTLYFLFFNVMIFTIGYGIAGHYGSLAAPTSLAGYMSDLWRWTPIIGTVTGMLLGWYGVPRPAPLATLNHILIPVVTASYLLTMGTTLRFGHIRQHWRPALAMAGIKLVFAPLIGVGLAYLLGYHLMLDGLLFKITLLESSMPPAMVGLALAALFHMDQDFANSCWIVSTLLSLLTIPTILYLL